MYPTVVNYADGNLDINQAVEGAKLESKIEQLMHEHESTGEQTAPLLYTAREQGVKEATNIRTDRWEIAVEAAGRIARSYMAKREERARAGKEPDQKPAEGEAQRIEKDVKAQEKSSNQ